MQMELWFYKLSQDLKGIRMFLLMIPEVKLQSFSAEQPCPQTWLSAVGRQWGDVAPQVNSKSTLTWFDV